MSVEKIKNKHQTFAIIIRSKTAPAAIKFFTPDDFSLQMGKHHHPKGKKILPHKHCPVMIKRKASLHEVLYIEHGQVKATFYDEKDKKIASKILQAGDMALLMEGGHGFEFLKPTKMIEIKQGPYMPESKKPLNLKK